MNEQTKGFIIKARKVHGDRYDYSKVVYVKPHEKVIIICKIHNEFSQTPSHHLQKRGCCDCGGRKKMNTESFIVKAQKIHGDVYDYSKVVYVKSGKKVIITCVNCKTDFPMTPNKHLSRGDGCKLCSRKKCNDARRSNVDDFIKKSKLKHVDGSGVPIYGYDKVVYINGHTHVIITCNKHSDFNQQPKNHLWWFGCNQCSNANSGNNQRLTTEQFIEQSKRIHTGENGNPIYGYDKVVYINSHTDVIITCNKHSDFNQRPNNHLNGANCPMCSNKTETKLFDALKHMYPTVITQFKQEWCKKSRCLPFDLCIPNHNIIIELDGAQHFRQVSNWTSPEDTFKNDLFKEKCANDNGYSVIRILQEDVFGDKYDWLSNLQTEIENIIKDDTIIHNIYMCENGEYDNFILE